MGVSLSGKETYLQAAFPFRCRADRTVLETCLVDSLWPQGSTLTLSAGPLLGALEVRGFTQQPVLGEFTWRAKRAGG